VGEVIKGEAVGKKKVRRTHYEITFNYSFALQRPQDRQRRRYWTNEREARAMEMGEKETERYRERDGKRQRDALEIIICNLTPLTCHNDYSKG